MRSLVQPAVGQPDGSDHAARAQATITPASAKTGSGVMRSPWKAFSITPTTEYRGDKWAKAQILLPSKRSGSSAPLSMYKGIAKPKSSAAVGTHALGEGAKRGTSAGKEHAAPE